MHSETIKIVCSASSQSDSQSQLFDIGDKPGCLYVSFISANSLLGIGLNEENDVIMVRKNNKITVLAATAPGIFSFPRPSHPLPPHGHVYPQGPVGPQRLLLWPWPYYSLLKMTSGEVSWLWSWSWWMAWQCRTYR